MAEELINVLTYIPELKVVARTSAFAFKGKETDVRDIGQKLNVKTILEGSVRKSGNQLRISAQLIDVNDGYHLWSQTYDRELKDVFAIQDEISSAIVTALKTKFLPEEKKILEKIPTTNTEAYQLYLKGRFYWNKRTVDALLKANDYFNQAIGIEPDYALAYAGLALSYVCFPQFGFSAGEFFLKAEAAAEKALTLDSTLADAYSVLGDINSEFRWDWAGAEKQYLKAIELNPGNPTTHQWYASLLLYTGKTDQAVAEIQYAYDLDPLSLIINNNLGEFYYYAMHQYDRAIEQHEKTIELDSNFWAPYAGLGTIYGAQGEFNDAIKMYQKAQSLQSMPSLLSRMGCIYIKAGKQIDGMKILKELLAYSSQGYQVSYDIACLYCCLGEKDKSFEWLEKSCENREEGILDLTFDPFWDSFHRDPRFIALLRKMGLEK
jgi:tetratricopeptide (TPR) repeat protein